MSHHSIADAASPIRVFLIDDHRLVLWGLERLIAQAHPPMLVVGRAVNRSEALRQIAAALPDVVVLDPDLAGEDGLDCLPAILAQSSARVLALTPSRDPVLHDRAIMSGARGVLDKSEPPEMLIKAIEAIHQGEMWMDRSATGRIFLEMARRQESKSRDPQQLKIASLTRKEQQIVLAIAADAAAAGRQIAERMHISEHTLRNHLTAIYAKLELSNRVELYAYANRHMQLAQMPQDLLK